MQPIPTNRALVPLGDTRRCPLAPSDELKMQNVRIEDVLSDMSDFLDGIPPGVIIYPTPRIEIKRIRLTERGQAEIGRLVDALIAEDGI